ncbi:Diphosphomevalonate decarboxylase [Phaffia rhodozyma]|uniref:Diphosphomevalonate decarboxylase n=1 Tax=Phaffia rhodozyma TaxID=264483 RepID=A0A0F7SN57_PHARH|nr:Diphosphomevalonate decarboxylase [Phaffia rhodozyma]
MVHIATASAPVNIACIKYWGKRDTKLILPTNSSLSVTLDQDHLRSTTSSACDASFEKDRLWLNGIEEEVKAGGRLDVCIKEMKKLRAQEEEKDAGLEKLSSFNVHLASYNNFPTAAGLASSASGLAALVASLASLYNLPTNASELSLIARQGSGSACRSLFGGFVAWEQGKLSSGTDSFAVQVEPREHWPSLHALICVVSDEKKTTASTAGMQTTVNTSPLLQHRIEHVVPARMEAITQAIRAKDFDSFAKITMKDSNQFHAVCLDSEPPIFYLNDVSRSIIHLVTELNRVSVQAGGPVLAAYTFDAGPNAVIYAEESSMPEIIRLIERYFPLGTAFENPFGVNTEGGDALREGFNQNVAPVFRKGSVARLIHTRIGDGPRTYGEEESLIGEDGLPKVVKA